MQPEHVAMAAWVEDLAGRYTQVDAVERLGIALHVHEHELLVTQWIIRSGLKASELGLSLSEDLLSQRFVSAQAMTRSLLEVATFLAWATDPPTRAEQVQRVRRCLKTTYEGRLNRGHTLPRREQELLTDANRDGLRNRPDVRGMLRSLDAAEAQRPGGITHWESHYRQFGLSSDYFHDPFIGVGVFAVDVNAGVMHIGLEPDVRVGLLALRWGGFYLVRSLDAVLRFAGLDDEADELTLAYVGFKRMGESVLQDLTD